MNYIRSVQVNLNHSINATDNLLIFISNHDFDIVFIQEPWVNKNIVMGLSKTNYNLFYKRDTILYPRSCILVKTNLCAFLLNDFSDRDTTTVKLESGNESAVIVSAYFSHFVQVPPPSILHICSNLNFKNLIIACDSNSRNILWGSSENNERGEELLDFILQNNLKINNVGSTPTFIFPRSINFDGWEQVLDVTFSSCKNTISIEKWHVSLENSFSDHRYIIFDFTFSKHTQAPFRNPRNTNWDKFKRKFDHFNISSLQVPTH